MKNRLFISTNYPAPYFIDYLEELSLYFDIDVYFEKENSSWRNKNWFKTTKSSNIKAIFLNKSTQKSLSTIKKAIKTTKYFRIIVCNPTTKIGALTLLFLQRHKIHHIIQSEGGFQGSGKGIKEWLKKKIMGKADFYLTGMGGNDDYFLMYGATPDKLKKYNFTSLRQKDILVSPPTENEKRVAKQKIGLQDYSIVLFVGQFIKRKGIDLFLKAISKTYTREKTMFVLIGGTPTDEYISIISELKINNVMFLNFMDYDSLKIYYTAADLFAMFTREDTWGLVINEALANALPTITTTKCISGRYLIKDDYNGYLVDIDDIDGFANSMSSILNNSLKKQTMASNALESIRNYSIEQMASTIADYLKESKC